MRRSNAFTLIELLVVITIIVALLAIALPSFRGAFQTANTMVCASNMRQLQQALVAYGGDYLNRTPLWRAGANRLWHDPISPYVTDIDAIRFCPETIEHPNAGNSQYGFGNATLRWWDTGKNGLETGSYGFNGFFYNRKFPGTQFFGTDCPFKTPDLEAWWDTVGPPMAGVVPVFFDCIFVDAWPHHDNPLPGIPRSYNNGDMMQRIFQVDGRHGEVGINIAFADGHAEPIRPQWLWDLKWNGLFELQGEVPFIR